MLDASFLDSRAAAMESLLRAYLAALPTSFVNNEGPAALRSLLGQSASAAAGTCDTPWCTPAATPRSTTSGVLNVPISLYSPIHEDSGNLKQADQTDQVHEPCKKVLFEAGLEKVADGPSPVRAARISHLSAFSVTGRSKTRAGTCAAPTWCRGYPCLVHAFRVAPAPVAPAPDPSPFSRGAGEGCASGIGVRPADVGLRRHLGLGRHPPRRCGAGQGDHLLTAVHRPR